MRIGVIGGTGLYGVAASTDLVRIETPYGPATVQVAPLDDQNDLVFLNRHGADHDTPPHRIDPRRTIDALARCRVDAIIAVNNTGGLRADLAPGHVFVPDDLIDLTGRTDGTFHDDGVVHIDLSVPYCPGVRAALLAAARAAVPPERLHDGGTYVGVRGPRLETPAEVRWLRTLGDVVGMTGCPEAALARERGLCYASLCFVANAAAGTGGPLAAEAIRAVFHAHLAVLQDLVRRAAGSISADRSCACRTAPELGRMGPPPVA